MNNIAVQRILVTGAGGFLGHSLANQLVRLGHNVTGVDIHYEKEPVDGQPIGFHAVIADFRDIEQMNSISKGVDVVYHLASAHLKKSLASSEYWDINVYSLKPFLQLLQANGVRRFIHTSSVGLFGNLTTWPANERSTCHPQSIYGETKLAGEKVVEDYCRENRFPF